MVSMVAGVETHRWPDGVGGEWTVEMLDLLPEDNLRYELLDGTLLVTPAPAPLHQIVAANLFRALDAVVPDDHAVLFAPLDWRPDGRTALEPDLMVIRKNYLGGQRVSQAPTLVVEVLSPSSARIDRLLKFSRYAEGGIGQYWIVDPAVPAIEVYELVDGEYVLLARGQGAEAVAVTSPLTLSVVPDDVVAI